MITDNRDRTYPLPTDSYYRGYRFSHFLPGTEEEVLHIYSGPELIDTVLSSTEAKALVDSWHDAR